MADDDIITALDAELPPDSEHALVATGYLLIEMRAGTLTPDSPEFVERLDAIGDGAVAAAVAFWNAILAAVGRPIPPLAPGGDQRRAFRILAPVYTEIAATCGGVERIVGVTHIYRAVGGERDGESETVLILSALAAGNDASAWTVLEKVEDYSPAMVRILRNSATLAVKAMTDSDIAAVEDAPVDDRGGLPPHVLAQTSSIAMAALRSIRLQDRKLWTVALEHLGELPADAWRVVTWILAGRAADFLKLGPEPVSGL